MFPSCVPTQGSEQTQAKQSPKQQAVPRGKAIRAPTPIDQLSNRLLPKEEYFPLVEPRTMLQSAGDQSGSTGMMATSVSRLPKLQPTRSMQQRPSLSGESGTVLSGGMEETRRRHSSSVLKKPSSGTSWFSRLRGGDKRPS